MQERDGIDMNSVAPVGFYSVVEQLTSAQRMGGGTGALPRQSSDGPHTCSRRREHRYGRELAGISLKAALLTPCHRRSCWC